ncbi:hypothetical protein D3C73_942030 [compost metagenome]
MDDLLDARTGIGHVGNGEGQAGARGTEHGVDQPRTAPGDDHHPVGWPRALFKQKARQALADRFQFAVAARGVLGNHRHGIGRASGVLQEVHENRTFDTILQVQRRVWARILHIIDRLPRACTR